MRKEEKTRLVFAVVECDLELVLNLLRGELRREIVTFISLMELISP